MRPHSETRPRGGIQVRHGGFSGVCPRRNGPSEGHATANMLTQVSARPQRSKQRHFVQLAEPSLSGRLHRPVAVEPPRAEVAARAAGAGTHLGPKVCIFVFSLLCATRGLHTDTEAFRDGRKTYILIVFFILKSRWRSYYLDILVMNVFNLIRIY